MPAPPVAAPTTRAPDHLDPLLARGARTSDRTLMQLHDLVCKAGHRDKAIGALTCHRWLRLLLTNDTLSTPYELWSCISVISSLTSAPQTEARQSLHMSGARAAEASEALGLTRMMAWLGRVPRSAAGERAMYRTMVFFSDRVTATVATSLRRVRGVVCVAPPSTLSCTLMRCT